MRFESDFIERVRDANNIVDVIGQYTTLTRAGGSFKGLCPFPDHKEKTPSFNVSDTKQVYHCFGCKRGGNVFKFFEQYQGMTFPEAVEFLARKSGIPIPEDVRRATVTGEDPRKLMFRLNRFAGAHFHRNLKQKDANHPIRLYLAKRGLSEEMIDEFKLGYAEAEWSELSQSMVRAKAPIPVAEKLGLIKKRPQAEGYFDLFRDRLMFPIISVIGNVVGFGGRTLGEQQPKYLNSPESEIFQKGRTLFGLNLTAKHIRSADEAFVVEGYMDLIGLYQAGVKNVVATLGTALTKDHARLLKRYCHRVVALFDSDSAGQAAAEKSLGVFLEAGLVSRHLVLPEGLDPDEFVRLKGVETFQKMAVTAPDHFVSFLDSLLRNYRGQSFEKVAVLEKVGPLLAGMADQRLQSLYARELADRLSVTEDWLFKNLVRPGQMLDNRAKNLTGGQVPLAPTGKWPKEEQTLIKLMLKNQAYLDQVIEAQIGSDFTNPEARQLAEEIIQSYCKKPSDFDKLVTSLVDKGFNSEVLTSSILEPFGEGPAEEQLVQDCIKRVRERKKRQVSRDLIAEMKNDSAPEKLEQFMNIARLKDKI